MKLETASRTDDRQSIVTPLQPITTTHRDHGRNTQYIHHYIQYVLITTHRTLRPEPLLTTSLLVSASERVRPSYSPQPIIVGRTTRITVATVEFSFQPINLVTFYFAILTSVELRASFPHELVIVGRTTRITAPARGAAGLSFQPTIPVIFLSAIPASVARVTTPQILPKITWHVTPSLCLKLYYFMTHNMTRQIATRRTHTHGG